MDLFAFFNLEVTDVGAFVVSCLLGYFAGSLAPHGLLSILTSLLVSYHLFLSWLVFGSRYQTAVPTSWVATLVTHACCMVLVIVPVWMARGIIPFYDSFRFAMVGLALFERTWLFSGSEIRQSPRHEVVELVAAVRQHTPKQLNPKLRIPRPGHLRASSDLNVKAVELPLPSAKIGSAYDAWQDHLGRQRPGTPEYEQWMRARRKQSRQQPAAH
jgi:hypothetical protein